MKIKQKKLSFAVPNVTSSPNRNTAGRNSVNNLSAPLPDQAEKEDEDLQESALEKTQRPKKKSFCQNYGCLIVWFALLMCIAAIVVPCILLLTMYVSPSLVFPYGDCVLLEKYRTPCMTGYSKVGQRECEQANCCWDTKGTKCYHSIPARHGYVWSSSAESSKIVTDTDFNLTPRLSRTPLLTRSYSHLKALLRFVSQHHLRIVIGTPGSSLLANVPSSNTNASNLEVSVARSAFAFEVFRKDDESRVSIVSSTRSPLIASDNYWEIGLRCPPDGATFGLGGLEPGNTTLLYSSSSRSSSFPYLMCLSPDGKAHGLMIRNSGPVEVSYKNGSKLIMLRALSNLGWDINILSGPTPGDVVEQLTEIVGRPKLPPYWALGFHVCRDFSSDETNSTGLNTTVVMDEFVTFLNSSISKQLPYDSDCIHERLLNQLNFTASSEVLNDVAAALDSLKANGKKFLLSLPPQVVEGNTNNFLLGENGSLYEGEYRDRKVFYPDFTSPNTSRWMASRLQDLSSTAANLSSVLAGFVLLDNWPEDISSHDAEQLPYFPQSINGSLSDNTVYWSALHWNNKRHYEIHNNYGLQQAESLKNATNLANPVIMSSSCTLGSPACLNQQQVSPNASWANLKEAVVSVLGSGLAGVPLAGGGPICGSGGDAPEDVCLRWYALAAVLPLARVTSSTPLHAATTHVFNAAITALKLRYSLLPYLYTVLKDSADSGEPLLRPMFYHFPQDPATWSLQHQFMVGPSLLAAPGLEADLPVVDVYLPADNTTWYMLDGGLAVNDGSGNLTVPISSSEAQLVLLLRGGHVLPIQEPGLDTRSSRLGAYKLVIALDYTAEDGDVCSATGHIVLEEDVEVTFYANTTSVTIGNLHEACSRVKLPPLTEVTVLRPKTRASDGTTTYQTTRNTPSSTVPPKVTVILTSTANSTPGTSTSTFRSSPTVTASTETITVSTSSVSSAETTGSELVTSPSTVSSTSVSSTVTSDSSSKITESTKTSKSSSTSSGSITKESSTVSRTSYTSTDTSSKVAPRSNSLKLSESPKRKKRQLSSNGMSSRFIKVKTPDTTQPLTFKLNSTSLCNGEDSILINYV